MTEKPQAVVFLLYFLTIETKFTLKQCSESTDFNGKESLVGMILYLASQKYSKNKLMKSEIKNFFQQLNDLIAKNQKFRYILLLKILKNKKDDVAC